MPPELRQRYRRIRNLWGWVIAFGWVAFWYVKLNTDYNASVSALGDCSGLFGSVRCVAASSGASAAFGIGMIFAILFAPLGFVISHYLARSVAESQQRADDQAKTVAARAEQKRIADAQAKRLAEAEADALSERQALDRKEFIRKLGTANDALDLLESETDPARRSIAQQAATNALRDLVAKHPLPEMTMLLADDEAARLSAATMVARLRSAGPLSADGTILERAMSPTV